DPDTPIEETMEALHDVVRSGKARYIGASSMFAWQFAKAQQTAAANGWTPFVSMQNHYNLLYREEEREMIPLCVDQGVGILPWSPLARGLLARPGASGTTETVRRASDPLIEAFYPHPDAGVLAGLAEVADARSAPPAQVALAWLLHKPIVAPIVGTTTTRHLDDAVAASELALTDDEIARLETPYRPQGVVGHR
ncbi:MAG TPA: aldo/keto reductase, partial [Acidimicrobiales bacterium]|nr:aldo/keto reductase [Acidimicrobiales bacterium]